MLQLDGERRGGVGKGGELERVRERAGERKSEERRERAIKREGKKENEKDTKRIGKNTSTGGRGDTVHRVGGCWGGGGDEGHSWI